MTDFNEDDLVLPVLPNGLVIPVIKIFFNVDGTFHRCIARGCFLKNGSIVKSGRKNVNYLTDGVSVGKIEAYHSLILSALKTEFGFD